MSTNDDLASLGEEPADKSEKALAKLLEKVLTKFDNGQVVQPESLKRGPPELAQRGRRLIQGATLLYQSAASAWEQSTLAPGEPRYSTLEPPKENVISPNLPDPFPGEYRLLRLLGEGAFGKVWLAQDLKLGWQVALKTLKSGITSTVDPKVLAALEKEARLLAKLDHPNIVRVHAWREKGNECYLVLQYVEGGSLADRVKKEKMLDWQSAARYIADVGEGLLRVHELGIVYRDIKPANILWNPEKDEALLTDFGVAGRLADPGSMAGTPAYMPFDSEVIPAVDVFSLSATLFHLVTGKLPFPGPSVPNLVYQVKQGLPDPDPRCSGMPEPLEQLIRAGLAPAAENRPSLAELVPRLRGTLNQLLADALVELPIHDRRWTPATLRIVVSRQEPDGSYKQVATTTPKVGRLARDMRKVPPNPEQVPLVTGDRVRVEVVADRTGHVTVFNIGPTGNLHLLYPEELRRSDAVPLKKNEPLHIVDVEMIPPVGPERLFAIWTDKPLNLSTKDLLSLAQQSGHLCTRPYRATRDMTRVKASLEQIQPDLWSAVALQVTQEPRTNY